MAAEEREGLIGGLASRGGGRDLITTIITIICLKLNSRRPLSAPVLIGSLKGLAGVGWGGLGEALHLGEWRSELGKVTESGAETGELGGKMGKAGVPKVSDCIVSLHPEQAGGLLVTRHGHAPVLLSVYSAVEGRRLEPFPHDPEILVWDPQAQGQPTGLSSFLSDE